VRVSPPTEFSVSGKKIVRDLAGFSKKKKIREKIVLKLFDNREVQKNHPQSFVCTRRPCTRLEKKIFLHEKQTKRKKKKKSSVMLVPLFFPAFLRVVYKPGCATISHKRKEEEEDT
jgi:hypothetical protein